MLYSWFKKKSNNVWSSQVASIINWTWPWSMLGAWHQGWEEGSAFHTTGLQRMWWMLALRPSEELSPETGYSTRSSVTWCVHHARPEAPLTGHWWSQDTRPVPFLGWLPLPYIHSYHGSSTPTSNSHLTNGGFPSLWSSWLAQGRHLISAGLHTVKPGKSQWPCVLPCWPGKQRPVFRKRRINCIQKDERDEDWRMFESMFPAVL